MYSEGTSVIIPVATYGYRMKNYGPKCLIGIGNSTILDRQIALLKKKFKVLEIVLVCGYLTEKMNKRFGKVATIVHNEEYQHSNITHAMRLALPSCSYDNVLLVYGDLVFNAATLNISYDQSFVLYDGDNQFNSSEVGLTVINSTVTQFSYGLPNKWAQIAFFKDDALASLRHLVKQPSRKNYYLFEIFNLILNSGIVMSAYQPRNMKIVEIDNLKDIDKAKAIL